MQPADPPETMTPPEPPDWFANLDAIVGITSAGSLAEAFSRTDRYSVSSAPNVRRGWSLLLICEALAVLAAVLWLMPNRFAWPPLVAGGVVTGLSMLMLIACWWQRWRGMQHGWTRSRLVAEILRSRLVTRGLAPEATDRALCADPEVQGLAHLSPVQVGGDEGAGEEAQSVAAYRADRIDGQIAYYQAQAAKAVQHRRQLSAWVSRSLDVALFISAAGIVIGFATQHARVMTASGYDVWLAVAGVLLPLSVLFCQSLNGYHGYDRRCGRYARTVQSLEVLRRQLDAAGDDMTTVRTVVEETERVLLNEVVDWYYQHEHVETFYRSRSPRESTVVRPVNTIRDRLVGWLFLSGSFVARVVLGRAVIVAAAVVATIAYVSFTLLDPTTNVRLLDEQQVEWAPDANARDNGLVIICHGLRGGVMTSTWMAPMARAIRQVNEGNPAQPDVCLVDWHQGARPTRGQFQESSNPVEQATAEFSQFLFDLAAIRPSGHRNGEVLAELLASYFDKGKLDRDRPLHLIGHSAGGFVVVQAALTLIEKKLLPTTTHITILDTPFMKHHLIEELANHATIDFYQSSSLAMWPPEGLDNSNVMYSSEPMSGAQTLDSLRAHDYANTWYTRTINNGASPGFGRSPFARDKAME